MDKKVFILAGGLSTRMNPVLTEDAPCKHLLPLPDNTRIITRLYSQVKKAGIEDICLVLGVNQVAVMEFFPEGTPFMCIENPDMPGSVVTGLRDIYNAFDLSSTYPLFLTGDTVWSDNGLNSVLGWEEGQTEYPINFFGHTDEIFAVLPVNDHGRSVLRNSCNNNQLFTPFGNKYNLKARTRVRKFETATLHDLMYHFEYTCP